MVCIGLSSSSSDYAGNRGSRRFFLLFNEQTGLSNVARVRIDDKMGVLGKLLLVAGIRRLVAASNLSLPDSD